MDFPRWPNYTEKEIKRISNILRTGKVNYWTGQEGKLFEKEYAAFCKTKYATAVSNGSVALSLSYSALGLKNNDEVITTPRTYIATSSSLALLGIKPVFADVDLDSGLITDKTIAPLISKKTRAISITHLAGWPADMFAICKLAKDNGLFVIEDCAQAHGASLEIGNDKFPVGSFGDVSAWSFCQDKIISTGGEGGMITTNNPNIEEFVWSIKDHGKSRKILKEKNTTKSYKYIHESLGSNFRLTEAQSALGRIQLEYLGNWTKIRKRNALILYKKLSKLQNLRIPMPPEGVNHAWYKFYVFLRLDHLCKDWSRERIIYEINSNGYPAFQGGCCEIYLEKAIKDFIGGREERLKNAKNLSETSLMFLLHPTINEKIMHQYADIIYKILKKSSL